MMEYSGRVGIQQRVLPSYRKPFFDLLAERCLGGLSCFAGEPLPGEGIKIAERLKLSKLFPAHNIHFNNPHSLLYLCWQRGIVGWLNYWDPNVLIIEANPRCLSTILAIRWMHQRERPVLGWGLGAPRSGSAVESKLRFAYLDSLDGIIAYSRRGAQEYQNLNLKSVFVAFNAAVRRPNHEPPNRPPIYDPQPCVLFVGRLQARKRVDILIKACSALPGNIQPKLVIVGEGPVSDELKNMAEKLYPETIFPGSVHGEALLPFFREADLFALPGTGGLAVQEAMSHGLPVIVAQGDGTQDDLVRVENGWQVTPGDQIAFTAALKEALMDPLELRLKGIESYRIVKEEINLDQMVDKFIEILRAQEKIVG